MTPYESSTEQDLDWLAFCYVSGELSSAELAAFEDRLATDEAACEAVARVMETNLAVAAVLASETTSSGVLPASASLTQAGMPAVDRSVKVAVLPRREEDVTQSRWVGATLVVAAVSAIAAMMMIAIGSSVLTGQKVARRDGTDRLVAAWAQGEAVRNLADDDGDSVISDDDDLDPPDWMLAAVVDEEPSEFLPGNDTPEVREN